MTFEWRLIIPLIAKVLDGRKAGAVG